MKVIMSTTAFRILAAALVAAGITACNKDNGAIDLRQTVEKDVPVEFSAYGATMPTKGVSYSADAMLGHWVDSTSTYVPGTGIGVFAFYQKAKSNGYPTNYNKYTGDPNFMYNQKLERTSEDGETFDFTYTPRKYWPNNVNDQLSFFAYAPYDEATAWEDLHIESTLKGDRVWGHYELENTGEDQTDFIWADPVLNMMKPTLGETVRFNLHHICAKISVTCQISKDDDINFITVDKVVFKAKFNTKGDYVYRLATGTSAWENLERSYHTLDYLQFKSSDINDQRVTETKMKVGGDDCYLFPFPGTQDITVTATLTHHVKAKPGTSEEETRCFTGEVSKTFTAMELEEGKAYNFHLGITLTPIDIAGAGFSAAWSDSVEYAIP